MCKFHVFFIFLLKVSLQNVTFWPNVAQKGSKHDASAVMYDVFLLSKWILTCILKASTTEIKFNIYKTITSMAAACAAMLRKSSCC